MKIWQAGASSNPYCVDGVCRTVWLLSGALARLGHDITLLFDCEPDPISIEFAGKLGLKILPVRAGLLSYGREVRKLLERERPEFVHMHSVFVPRQATLARELDRAGIRYLVTPHGGLAPGILARNPIKKEAYAWLRERPRFRGAAAVGLVTPGEARVVRRFCPDDAMQMIWLPNPVETDGLAIGSWQGIVEPKRLVYMGRFDVMAKGIDILVEIARLLPEFSFELYGTEDRRTLEWLNRLRQDMPKNVSFHAPVFEPADKARVLSGATMYLQPARWEGFPVSVAEAMYIGVPTAITDILDMAQQYHEHQLGLVLSMDPATAAEQIRLAVADEPRMRQWSRVAHAFALEYFEPPKVAERHVRLYQQLAQPSARKQARPPSLAPLNV